MKPNLLTALFGVACALSLTGCSKDQVKSVNASLTGVPGSLQTMPVAGAVRSESAHYKLIGASVPAGGTGSSAHFNLRDGALNSVR